MSIAIKYEWHISLVSDDQVKYLFQSMAIPIYRGIAWGGVCPTGGVEEKRIQKLTGCDI